MTKKNIYLLEDDADTRSMVAAMLAKIGHNVFSFGNAHDFNEQVEKALPDLFIMDVCLPDGNALDATKQIIDTHRRIVPPVLIMSGDYVNHDKAIQSGARCFMRKPFIPKDFLIRVQSLLAA